MQLNRPFSIVFILGHTWHSGLRAIFEHSSSNMRTHQLAIRAQFP